MSAGAFKFADHEEQNHQCLFNLPKQISSSSGTESKTADMSLVPLMFRSLLRLVSSMAIHPAASVTTVLFYSDLLPQSIALERLVRRDLLHEENYLLHLLINFLRCFL